MSKTQATTTYIFPSSLFAEAKMSAFVLPHKITDFAIFGSLNFILCVVARNIYQRYTEMPKEKGITRRVMEVNFFGAVNCTEAMLDQIRTNSGLIVNISSVAGFAPLLGQTAYAASKHALHGFFESLGAELQEEGVHCLMVCPSFIQAPKALEAKASAAKNSIYQDKKTIGPSVSAEDIANSIYKSCLSGKKTLVMGRTGKLSYIMRRFIPSVYERMMIKNLKNDI